MRIKLVAAVAAIALTATIAGAQDTAKAPRGYLAAGALDTYKILPPAPVPGTTRYEADRTTFLATRSLKDSDRWKLAQGDADEKAILKDFSCAAGVELSPETTPKLAALLLKARFDVRTAVNTPKDIYKRQRPYLIDEGPICVDKTDDLAKSPDYPSGHTTWGWTVGLLLAELVPDHATEILVRGRSFGESRVVCGVHNASAIEAGRTNASALVAALHGSAEFRADMDKTRKELAALKAKVPDPAQCKIEEGLVAKTPY